MRHPEDAEAQFEAEEPALQPEEIGTSKFKKYADELHRTLRGHYIGASLAIVAVAIAAVASLIYVNQSQPVTTSVAVTESDRTVSERADRSKERSLQPTTTPTTTAPSPAPPPPPPPPPAWVSPVASYDFTSGFGQRWGTIHAGADLANGTGTPILAAAAGTVTLATTYDWGGYGFTVVIDHGNGIQTLYGHNSQVSVGEGQHVEPGQVIALMGSTGNSTGPHCHFEVHTGGGPILNGNAVDPVPFMRNQGVDLPGGAKSVESNG